MTPKQLITLLQTRNLTSQAFADLIGVSLGCVRKWRTGERKISKFTASAIITILDKETP